MSNTNLSMKDECKNANVHRKRTLIDRGPSRIGCSVCNHGTKLGSSTKMKYEGAIVSRMKAKKLKLNSLETKPEANSKYESNTGAMLEEHKRRSENRTIKLIAKFNENSKPISNEHKLENRRKHPRVSTKVFDGGNSIGVKMNGKGRVKDLVKKLNGEVNYESIRTIENKTYPNDEFKDENANENEHNTSTNAKAQQTADSTNSNGDCDQCDKKVEKIDLEKSTNNNWLKTAGIDALYKVLSEKHSSLQKAHSQLQKRLSEEEEQRKRIENELENSKNDLVTTKGSTLQIQRLKDCENRLLAEIQELREQNELLEFRLLELEYYDNSSKQTTERTNIEEITERDENSDSGVMSLSPCEDFYSEADLLDIKLDDEEPRITGSEVQQKLSRLFQCTGNTCDKVALQQAMDLIKHYEMRIIGMETTLTNMCQERIQQHSEEFLTSLKNAEEYSKSKTHRVIATVSPFTSSSKAETCLNESLTEKLFFDADRLQESGIFDEFPEHDLTECKSTETQTDSANLIARPPSLDSTNSSSSGCSSTVSSGLADELSKLEKIKRRIEERGPLFSSSSETDSKECVRKVPIVTLSMELTYFKKQYDILKNKLAAFESSGDSKIKQLAETLQKENDLQNRVEFLTKNMAKMEKEMRRLEEEKCEYEEAENDARLRCQKLEVKLYALAEKKNDLQFQLQQHMRTVSTLRNTISELEKKKEEAFQKSYEMEILMNDYEERNFELEEREMDVRYSLQILETAFPVLLFWNLYILFQSCKHDEVAVQTPTKSLVPISCDCSKLKAQTTQLENRISILEKDLRKKEHTIAKLRNDNGEMCSQPGYRLNKNSKLKQYRSEFGHTSRSPFTYEYRSNLQEEVYVQTLQQADEIIVNIENDFKRKLEEMQNALTDKHWKLEECERKLAVVSSSRAMENHFMEKTQNLEADISTLKQMLRTKDEEKQSLIEKEKCIIEEMDHLNTSLSKSKNSEDELRKKLENERNLNKEHRKELQFKENEIREFETTTNNQMKQLQNKILNLTREIENQEVTNGELKEEVETLENAICELNLRLNHDNDEKEKMLVKLRQELAFKQEEIDSMKRLSRDMTAINTAQEISLLQNEKLKSTSFISDKYSNTLPRIICVNEQNDHKIDARIGINKVKSSIEKINGRSESSAHIIRHRDRYTILLKPLAGENYSNFEVVVNNHRLPMVHQCKQMMMENGVQNDTISLTIKPI